MSLEARILALEGGGTREEKEEEEEEKFSLCVKAKVIGPFGAASPKTIE